MHRVRIIELSFSCGFSIASSGIRVSEGGHAARTQHRTTSTPQHGHAHLKITLTTRLSTSRSQGVKCKCADTAVQNSWIQQSCFDVQYFVSRLKSAVSTYASLCR